MPDDLDVLLQLLDGHAHPLGDFGDLVVLQQAQVLGDDRLAGRGRVAEMTELQREALLQVTRGDTDRVEVLEDEQDRLDLRL